MKPRLGREMVIEMCDWAGPSGEESATIKLVFMALRTAFPSNSWAEPRIQFNAFQVSSTRSTGFFNLMVAEASA